MSVAPERIPVWRVNACCHQGIVDDVLREVPFNIGLADNGELVAWATEDHLTLSPTNFAKAEATQMLNYIAELNAVDHCFSG